MKLFLLDKIWVLLKKVDDYIINSLLYEIKKLEEIMGVGLINAVNN